MNRKVLLIEPDYKNKYPPMSLMKISTYYRHECKDDVRFFKGDLKDFAAQLLYEELYVKIQKDRPQWKMYFNEITALIKGGRYSVLDKVPDWRGTEYEEIFKSYRARYMRRDFPTFDIICITTLFTFYWKKTIETINQAKMFLKPNGKIFVGGVAASILPDKIEEATGIRPHVGLLNSPDDFGKSDDVIIDELPLDYSILDEIDYEYPDKDAYYGYMTRGCIRHCSFCAVPTIEPVYKSYISIKDQIDYIDRNFGKKRFLLLMDNNVFASSEFDKIIDEIKEIGFENNASFRMQNEYEIAYRNLLRGINDRAYIKKFIKLYNEIESNLNGEEAQQFHTERERRFLLYSETATKNDIMEFDDIARPAYDSKFKPLNQKRYIDFNQGVDARLVTEEKMKKLAETSIRPLRIAFDHYEQRDIYLKAIYMAADYGIKELSNYILYNFHDKPEELYERLKINVDLCEELNIKIYSFPMKYHPINDPEYFNNRNFIGEHWNRKFIRAVQAVINATKGKIGRGQTFFEEAFGHNHDEFFDILWMPESLIINRFRYKYNVTMEWRAEFNSLSPERRKLAEDIIAVNDFSDKVLNQYDEKMRHLLEYYRIPK